MTLTNPDLPLLPLHASLWQETVQWQPTSDQQTRLQRLFEEILTGNQQMNLTRIIEPTEFWEKHLWDAISGLVPWLSLEKPPWWCDPTAPLKAIDIGTGAGIPGLPAAIALPHWNVTLLDATQKKVRFLDELAKTLKLENVRAIADRVEYLAHQPSHRELYDVAMLRAVGSAATCTEYALPLLKQGGTAILYRGQWSEEDSDILKRVVARLGGELLDVRPWLTPLSQSIRHCIYLGKSAPTDEEFPRSVGTPAKFPLMP